MKSQPITMGMLVMMQTDFRPIASMRGPTKRAPIGCEIATILAVNIFEMLALRNVFGTSTGT
ncbi:unnamed protein product, partial [Nesidiocoris tenuis]